MNKITFKQHAILRELAYGERSYRSLGESIHIQKFIWSILYSLYPFWISLTAADMIEAGLVEGFWSHDGQECLRIKDKGLAAYCYAVHGDDPEVIRLLARFWDGLKTESLSNDPGHNAEPAKHGGQHDTAGDSRFQTSVIDCLPLRPPVVVLR